MTKICPDCKIEYSDDHGFCSQCGHKLEPKQEAPPSTLHIGDANAISGGINIDQSKTIHHHDVYYQTVQERSKSDQELEQERRSKYCDAVTKWMHNGTVTMEARIRLDNLKAELCLNEAVVSQIEEAVKRAQTIKTSGEPLSVIAKMALNNAIAAVEGNHPQAADHIKKLALVYKSSTNEQVAFYYNLLLSAFDTEQCVAAYEHRVADSYWQSFWACLAYRILGMEMEADTLLNEMSTLWPDRPESDVIVNVCVGHLILSQGDINGCRDVIMKYLCQATDKPSELLNDLFHALLHEAEIERNDNPRFAFYEDWFFTSRSSVISKKQYNKAEAAYAQGDYETAMSIWQRWANRGDAYSQYSIGYLYEAGQGVTMNYSEAIKWYRKAVDQGHIKASRRLGSMYYLGQGVPEDHVYGVKLFQKAAEQGDCSAQFLMGTVCETGDGKAQSYAEAAQWYQKAADQGDAEAQCSLAKLYEDGKGVDRNDEEALKWYRKAADQGHAEAQENVKRLEDEIIQAIGALIADQLKESFPSAFP